MEILLELQSQMKLLDASLKQYRKTGTDYAQTEHDYKVALSKKVLELRAEGQAVTLIQLIAYGDKEVALKRLQRDIALATYEANKEAINVKKLQVKVLQAQIEKEYYNND